MTATSLGETLDRLAATVAERAGADPAQSYTASLLAGGVQRCAKKLGEEAVETALAAVSGDQRALAEETADLLFHLVVLLQASHLSPETVAEALARRRGVSGHDEKAKRRPE